MFRVQGLKGFMAGLRGLGAATLSTPKSTLPRFRTLLGFIKSFTTLSSSSSPKRRKDFCGEGLSRFNLCMKYVPIIHIHKPSSKELSVSP